MTPDTTTEEKSSTTDLDRWLDESDLFAADLLALIDLPLLGDSSRVCTADIACSLALEHWNSVRVLLRVRLLPSALVVHRSQFEALLRSVWLTYAASDSDVSRLAADLNPESEQLAKNVAQAQNMMEALAKSGPVEAHDALTRFKENSWKALNSYAHAGVHPLRRHADGYPVDLLRNVLCNANGLAVMSAMQSVVLSGEQPLQRKVLDLARQHPSCMPSLL